MIELLRDGAVLRLHIRRAERRNAFVAAMWQTVRDVCRGIADGHDAAVRALVLEGEPGIFSAGADIEELRTLLGDADALAANHELAEQAQAALEALPVPTLALIDGPCFGGGVGLASACDFRLGSERARLAVTPARLGLIYSAAATRRLLRLAGDTRTRRLLLRGEVLDAAQAQAWGLLDEVVAAADLPAQGHDWAQQLAASSRVSMAGIKATLRGLASGESEAAMAQRFHAAMRGPDIAEGVAAFLEKRAARFD